MFLRARFLSAFLALESCAPQTREAPTLLGACRRGASALLSRTAALQSTAVRVQGDWPGACACTK